MAKVNIFDSSTWDDTDEAARKIRIRNRVKGALTQKIGIVKKMLVALEAMKISDTHTKAYEIARNLESNNYVAFKVMNITFEYSDSIVKGMTDVFKYVLDLWKNDLFQEEPMEHIIAQLKPYEKDIEAFENGAKFSNYFGVKVHGNSAWDVYLDACLKLNESEELREMEREREMGYARNDEDSSDEDEDEDEDEVDFFEKDRYS